ncbi:MAG TPA: PSD1 and planctomycete cytochrome C domain-containing protein [Lacipirellulaceae bacterium]|nr:PSD1 and planctomycete cytochrome C domain-containing protein [Lacipirellulaceae bacterium]
MIYFRIFCLVVVALLTAIWNVSVIVAAEPAASVDFNRDVRPILSNNCFRCHGPDPKDREADLRLDVWKSVGKMHGAEAVIDADHPGDSELVKRITSDDPDERMPPQDSGKTLRPEQIKTLRTWVENGAKYEPHWAYVAPQRPAVPAVKNSGWVRNPIDAFVLAKLEKEGLEPSPRAATSTLIRRLSLDIVGLPPTLDELKEFESHASGNGYEDAVERLLASPHFGERWGRVWLDVARYADSDGFEKDKPRFVWMYRDWVINALNQDLPYDKFVIDQIAGDLLPHATQDDKVATGFLRNSMINEEGGIDPEQFRMEAMYDRMDAIGKGVLGITIQCAQCHTHKYDPLTQTEYYQMFAFLNNCYESQTSVYTAEQQSEWQATGDVIRRIEDQLQADSPDWQQRMAEWEKTVRKNQPTWTVVSPPEEASGDQKHYVLDDGSILAAGYAPTKFSTEFTCETKLPRVSAVRLELMNDPSLPHGGPGRSIFGTCALTEFNVEAAPLDHPEKKRNLQIAKATADVNPPERELEKAFEDRSGKRRVTGPIEFATDGNNLTAWGINIGPERSNVPRKAVFEFDKPIESAGGVRLTFKLVQDHGGWNSDDNQTNNLGRFRFAVTSADNAVADPLPSDVRAIVDRGPEQRTAEETQKVFEYWRTTVPEWEEQNRRIEALWQSHPQGTTQLTLTERGKMRTTHRLERGNFLAPAEAVERGVPAFLHPLEKSAKSDQPPTRLDFAKWLVDRRSPTTARSIVNRIWQAYFGKGLVATPEDFGMQGDPPSNRELLDWLAVELMDHNWSLKHIHRLIVTSATYQQSSAVTPQLLEQDPDNRLLARGPRFRVDAEIVRDVALSASSLLDDKIGGPSVFPPAPEFLFKPPASYGPKTWKVATGPDRYRRGLYTFRFRSVPYPMLQNFDAPVGEVACARRARSNTPLQALTTLNEPIFVECARALTLTVLRNAAPTDEDRIDAAMKRCVSREPHGQELRVLEDFLNQERQRFTSSGEDPWPLLADGEQGKQKLAMKMPNGVSPGELASWTAVARVILNLDETITNE